MFEKLVQLLDRDGQLNLPATENVASNVFLAGMDWPNSKFRGQTKICRHTITN